ncbi:M23 family metallopeptidase [Algoriphagus mannitolivorans]|uniref:M23 family metallopeptidase n=1 Tax=Algoriphagus mannitolivorans TaxID=226504 RepID=UPI0004006855|nr:M23 family metallopeptidase [Algoriphagus mannitolivorans]
MKSNYLKILFGLILSIGFLEANAQVFPKIIKKNTNQVEVPAERRNIELRQFDQDSYLRTLTSQTDSILFQGDVNLSRIRSIISEDPLGYLWSPTNQLIKISEQVQIDSIWVTAFEHYSNWDSKKVDIYNFDIRNFQDSLLLRLYDPRFGMNWKFPLDQSKKTSEFGPRWGRMHYGTDLDLETGDPVYAGFDGIVRVKAYDRYGWGYFVVVRHKNGLETLYGHLSKQIAQVGDEVRAGDIIGKGGSSGRSTGSHLHYEMRYKGLAFDPEKVYDFETGELTQQDILISKDLFSHVAKARAAAYHRVKRGDTLGSIARRYGVPISQITRLNGISTRTILRVGQNLRVK